MPKFLFVILFICCCSIFGYGQHVHIEPHSGDFRVDPEVLKLMPELLRQDYSGGPKLPDSSFKTECGYLVVPENRKKKNSNWIKLPFIIVKAKSADKRPDPLFFTSGGPGSSSLALAADFSKRGLVEKRDCIVLEQRGTNYALPNLRTFELDNAIKEAVRKNLNRDSMTLVGLKRYKAALEKRGIDLAGYNTDETVSDILDLFRELKLDSVNLYGGSYSGGLMTAVLQRDPSHIRSLVLDSPLPTFVPIDEDGSANMMEALNIYFKHVEIDSAANPAYANLRQRFNQYFNSIIGKTFHVSVLEAGTKDSLRINYTKNELIDIVGDKLVSDGDRKGLAATINNLIAGRHEAYIRPFFTSLLRRNNAPSGMRIAVTCADQFAYHSETVRNAFNTIYPYFAGYHSNDVYPEMCDCWKAPPINTQTKQPLYSNKPVLLADGEMDPDCRPLYVDRISHYMPNSQRFLVINKGHGVMDRPMIAIMNAFLDDPYKKIVPTNKNIIAY